MGTAPQISRLIFGFCTDLTLPEAPTIEVGVLKLRGEDFDSFTWCLDYTTLGLGPFAEQIFHCWPEVLRSLVWQWPAFRDGDVEYRGVDLSTIEGYITSILSRSSFVVLRVEPGEVSS